MLWRVSEDVVCTPIEGLGGPRRLWVKWTRGGSGTVAVGCVYLPCGKSRAKVAAFTAELDGLDSELVVKLKLEHLGIEPANE